MSLLGRPSNCCLDMSVYGWSSPVFCCWGFGVWHGSCLAACSLCVEGLMFKEDKFLYLIDILHPPPAPPTPILILDYCEYYFLFLYYHYNSLITTKFIIIFFPLSLLLLLLFIINLLQTLLLYFSYLH